MDYHKLLNQLYQDFNDRKIDAVLAHVHTDVTWPNGWEGGFVHGKDEVRAYWLRQWQEINPELVPVSIHPWPDGAIAVDVHQIIKDLNGQVLSDSYVIHVYRFEEGKVRSMSIEQK
ncbi:nuclear transport factor 2 family protein [Dyadobacter flavalbus]|uniref:Nuclear transport factor 2 family protein n=1 Tax=Dyadobacter flavalbus TaxID=2579942 RepID=A0A5M8QC88_9BACT|nr:nuclear transport factor 2 family protein [Dyadobacter flavalbus]KAA6432703.1 nuclear transport factor 2 family protein [Dyadobacter flavalbus]